ncbi:MAG: hypothetical protein IT313_11085 [Anaerolineales bacterium]|nr:hypothetical protein [Anaerolineales bacterium]
MSSSGQKSGSNWINWLIAIVILLAPFLLKRPVPPQPIPAPTDIEPTSPTDTKTIERMGVKETIAYQCNANHEIIYSVVILSPFGGISPYTIEVTPLVNGVPKFGSTFIVDPEKPFSYEAGQSFSYTVSSNTQDKQPQITSTVAIPTNSDELCGTQQPITKVFVNETSSPQPPEKEKPDTEDTIGIPVVSTDTPMVNINSQSSATSPPSSDRAICNDGQDNDNDGWVDFPADPECKDIQDNHEDS